MEDDYDAIQDALERAMDGIDPLTTVMVLGSIILKKAMPLSDTERVEVVISLSEVVGLISTSLRGDVDDDC